MFKGRKGKWLLLLISVPLWLVLLVHVQPVEQLILRKISRQLPEGFSLRAARLDLNLFKLSARLQDVVLEGPSLKASAAEIFVNAGSGVLMGDIHLDEILAKQGEVIITTPEEPAPPKEQEGPLTIPPIRLGHAGIEEMSLRLNETQTQINLDLEQIAFDYEQDKLQLTLINQPMSVGGRGVPALNLDISGTTTQFQSVEDLVVKLTSAQSRFVVKGRLDVGSSIDALDLDLDALLSRDLVPELPGIRISGGLHDGRVNLETTAPVPYLNGQTRKLRATTDFDLAQPLEIPLSVALEQLMDGSITLTQTDNRWHGDYQFKGDPREISGLHPLLEELQSAVVTGTLALDDKGPVARARVNTQGMPSMDVHLNYNRGALTFRGKGTPLPSSQLSFSGDYGKNGVQVETQGVLAHLDGLPGLEIPPELCAGPIAFEGQMHSDLKTWHVDQMTLDLAKVAYLPYLDDHMVVSVAGDQNDLHGSLFARHLNPFEALAEFSLNVEQRSWNHLSVSVDAQDLFIDGQRTANLKFRAEGDGHTQAPNMQGEIIAHAVTDAKQATLETPFILMGRDISLWDMYARSAHGTLSGDIKAHLDMPLNYEVDLALDLTPNDAYQPLLALEVPRGQFTLNGNQEHMLGKFTVPGQQLTYEAWNLPLESDFTVDLSVDPPGTEVSGSAPEWTIAGMGFSKLNFNLNGDQLEASMHLRAKDPAAIRKAAGDLWPKDLSLANFDGDLNLRTDLSLKDPKVDLRVAWLEGGLCNGLFWAKGARIHYGETVSIDPFKAHFAGLNLEVAGANPSDARWPEQLAEAALNEDDIGLSVRFALDEEKDTCEFLQLPQNIVPKRIEGTAMVFTDLLFKRPRAAVLGLQVDVEYDDYHRLEVTNLDAHYYNGIWAEGRGSLDDLDWSLSHLEDGFQLHAKPSSTDIENWVTGFVGGATFDATLNWHNRPKNDFALEMLLVQEGSALVYLDPWLAFTNLHLALSYDTRNGLVIQESGGNVNGGTIQLEGNATLGSEEERDVQMNLVADDVTLNLVDLSVNVSTALEWHADDEENILRATTYVNQGYYAPREDVKALVQDIISAVPELYFPDPFLEDIQLEAFVSTTGPLIVETDIAYVEAEAPWLNVGGTLAEPRPEEGYIFINKGSSLDLSNQVYVFHDSQIQFIRNRPDDPYLLISLESAEDVNKNSINLTGFLSELGNNTDTQNLSTILVNYMVGEFSTMISLEPSQGKTLFDDSFSFVVSKSLSSKLVTRYAIPVNQPRSEQRVELSVGPYRNNYLNLANQNDLMRGDLQHSRKFGYPKGKRPPQIRKIEWPKDTPKWVRKSFKLKREQHYSETLWRRARLDLERRLKEKGYLTPTLSHTWEDRRLTMDFAFGPRTAMAIDGLRLSKDDRAWLFRAVPSLDEEGMRALEGQVERMASAKGYPSSSAFARLDEGTIRVKVLVSQVIEDLTIDFGEANSLLSPYYNNQDKRRAFVGEYLLSADRARARLRARLAAKGFLSPDMGPGNFEDTDFFSLPIVPGPQAKIVAVVVNEEQTENPYIGRSFDVGLMSKVAGEMQVEAGKQALVRLRPRKVGSDVALDVTRTDLEETIIESLSITGTDRIKPEKIKRYMDFEPGMTQKDLIKAQDELVKAGPFSSVRLRAEADASIEVLERNRWDADYLVSWDEQDEFGHALQFHDYQLFHGFNSLGMRMEQSKLADEFIGRLKFNHVWGSKLDVTLGYRWRNQKEDPNPTVDDEDEFFTITEWILPKVHEPSIELGYPLTEYQRLTLGATFNRTRTEFLTQDEFDGEITEYSTESLTISVPIRFSWLYKRLDYPANPRNGILATASVDYFTDQGESTVYDGLRYKTSLTTFKTFGRFMWSNRIETGIFEEDSVFADTPDPATTELFLLGGSTTVRGYADDMVGPLTVFFDYSDDNVNAVVNPQGGKAMFFSSQELTYTTTYFGLGFTPFVDAGWVWEDYKDYFDTRLAVSGGLGVSLDTPIGYFRIDWARPLDQKAFQPFYDENIFDDIEMEAFNKKHEASWYFRFGRVF